MMMKIPAVVFFFATIAVVIGSNCRDYVKTASSSAVLTPEQNSCCIFPFKWDGVTYTGCTTKDADKPWCETPYRELNNKWAPYQYCPEDYFGPSTIKYGACESKLYTYRGNAFGKCCVFPFTYEGKSYKECIKGKKAYKWCATTPNYDADGEYGQCPDEEYCDKSHVYTTGPVGTATGDGTATGACCVFPFTDGDKVHHSCADPEVGSGKIKKWCATTEDYNTDKMWGYCSNQKTCASGIYTASGNSNNECCHFPFKYNGKTYTECTTDGDDLWCSTTADYDKDKKYGYCPKKEVCTYDKQTFGGNGKKECCVFPFTYNGKIYNRCTNDDSNIGAWCATTDNFDRDRKYGFCEENCYPSKKAIQSNSDDHKCCVFPFVWKNVKYSTCTRVDFGRLWCGTTANVDKDMLYGFCEGLDYCSAERPKAMDVNSKELSCCHFPFVYKGETYKECTTVGFGRKWCGLTDNVDTDNLYGYCESADYCSDTRPKAMDANSKELPCCYFPFIYKNKTYTECTTVVFGRKWCGLTDNVDRDDLYGYCESAADYCSAVAKPKAIAPNTKDLPCCSFPFIYKGETYTECTTVGFGRKWCGLTGNVDSDNLYGYCESTADYCVDKQKTIGGNAKELPCCHFPFIYNGKTYNECTTVDFGEEWCSVTSNYDEDQLFGYCKPAADELDYCSAARPKAIAANSKELPCCYFPFIYKQKIYTECTTIDFGRKWCGLTDDVDRDGLYGYCESADYCSVARPKAIAANSKELPCCHFPFYYKGETYKECTTVGFGRKWCGLTDNVGRDKLYGYCESTANYCADKQKTIYGNAKELPCCHFPFIYKGETYNECTTVDFGERWCSVTSNFDEDQLYGYCEPAADELDYEEKFERDIYHEMEWF